MAFCRMIQNAHEKYLGLKGIKKTPKSAGFGMIFCNLRLENTNSLIEFINGMVCRVSQRAIATL